MTMADHPDIDQRRKGARRTALRVALLAAGVFTLYVALVAFSR